MHRLVTAAISRKYQFALVAVSICTVISALLHQYLVMFGLVIATLAFWSLFVFQSDHGFRTGFEGVATALTSAALLIGAYWYFVERRGVPKVNVEPAGQAWAVSGNGLLVRAEVKITNVGVSAVRLGKDPPMEVEIGQVYPLTSAQGEELRRAMAALRAQSGVAYALQQTDSWPLMASNYEGTDAVVIEAGESENLYYKAVIPCSDDIVLALTAKVPKTLDWIDGLFDKNRKPLFWTAQSIITTTA